MSKKQSSKYNGKKISSLLVMIRSIRNTRKEHGEENQVKTFQVNQSSTGPCRSINLVLQAEEGLRVPALKTPWLCRHLAQISLLVSKVEGEGWGGKEQARIEMKRQASDLRQRRREDDSPNAVVFSAQDTASGALRGEGSSVLQTRVANFPLQPPLQSCEQTVPELRLRIF